MKIAVVGAGGVGGYLGGLLARAGHEVALIARGDHLGALREHGLQVQSVHGDFHVKPIAATDRPADIGPVELTICTVKTYDLDNAAEAMRPLVGPSTAVLPLQNGVESAARLRQYYPAANILGGAVWIVAAVAAPGVIRQESRFRRVVIGELDGRLTPRVRAIQAALLEAGADAELTDVIERILWTKLAFIASFSGITSVTRAPAGPVMACAESRALFKRALEEVAAVAQAKGLGLDAKLVDDTLAFADRMDPTLTSSMQRDVAARRRLEYDAMNGAVVRGGRETGVSTPVHEFFWTCLKVVDSMAGGGPA